MSRATPPLPEALLRGFADSELEVLSWDGCDLVVKVTKDIGVEDGVIVFHDVTHVNLPWKMTAEGIRSGSEDHLPKGFFDSYRPLAEQLDAEETVCLCHL